MFVRGLVNILQGQYLLIYQTLLDSLAANKEIKMANFAAQCAALQSRAENTDVTEYAVEHIVRALQWLCPWLCV